MEFLKEMEFRQAKPVLIRTEKGKSVFFRGRVCDMDGTIFAKM